MRARNIKPGFFKNEILADLPALTRLLFIGLWCMADKDGYLEYRPKRIKAEILPYDSQNIDNAISQLGEKGFIQVYEHIQTKQPVFIRVNNFSKHQSPHIKEKDSEIEPLIKHHTSTIQARYKHGSNPPDSGFLIPDSGSLIPEVTGPTPTEVEPVVILFPLSKKGEEFGFTQSDIDQWKESFPGVDIDSEIRKCRQWNIDNPSRRKTARGIRQHVSSWLGRVQNRGNGRSSQPVVEEPAPTKAELESIEELRRRKEARKRKLEEMSHAL